MKKSKKKYHQRRRKQISWRKAASESGIAVNNRQWRSVMASMASSSISIPALVVSRRAANTLAVVTCSLAAGAYLALLARRIVSEQRLSRLGSTHSFMPSSLGFRTISLRRIFRAIPVNRLFCLWFAAQRGDCARI